MNYPPGPPAPPTGPQPNAPAQPKKGNAKRIVLIALSVLLGLIFLIVFASFLLPGGEEDAGPSIASDQAPPAVTADEGGEGLPTDPEEEPSSEPEPESNYVPKKADWSLKIKITDKVCYGSGLGCSVDARVSAKANGPYTAHPDSGVVEITYKITGDKSGAQIGTVTVYLADRKQEYDEHFLDTASSGTKITAKITEVEYNEWG